MIPKKKKTRPLPPQCFACGTTVMGPYCHACGQKNDDCRRSIVSLATEAMGDILDTDGRATRTLRSVLLRPGRHVRDYGDGRRSPYSPPIRFFLAITAVFFTTLWLTDVHFLSFEPKLETGADGQETLGFEPHFLSTGPDERLTPEERTRILERLAGEEARAELTVNGRHVDDRDLLNVGIAIVDQPGPFNNALNAWIPRLMIVMIPLMALMSALFIRGPDALLYDHLLVAINLHAVIFVGLTFAVWTAGLIPGGVMALILTAGIPLYFLLAQKGAFRRGWIKTTVASAVVLLFYSIFLVLGIGFAIWRSFASLV